MSALHKNKQNSWYYTHIKLSLPSKVSVDCNNMNGLWRKSSIEWSLKLESNPHRLLMIVGVPYCVYSCQIKHSYEGLLAVDTNIGSTLVGKVFNIKALTPQYL